MSHQDTPQPKRVKFDSVLSQSNSSSSDLQAMEMDREGSEDEEDEDMVTQVNQFFAELSSDKGRKKKRLLECGSNLPRRKSVLPPHLSQVMGNANLRLATGDRAGSIELCMEIIRQAPHASEPYLALATVYEDLGYDEKLLGILMIASHLKRSDCDMWVKTANLAVKLSDLKIAIHCISKAVKLNPTNVSLLWQKATLLTELNEPRKALDSLQTILTTLAPSMAQQCVAVTKEMARLYHSLQETPQAISILGQLLTTHHDLVDEEVINILAELCIITKAYEQVYEVVTDYYGMITQLPEEDSTSVATPLVDSADSNSNTSTTPDEHMTSQDSSNTPTYSLMATLRMSIAGEEIDGPLQGFLGEDQPPPSTRGQLHVPEEVPVDLRVKLAISMIHLGLSYPEELLRPVFCSPEDYGDLFMDITDALTECGQHTKALTLFNALINTRKFSQAGVWLKLAECQHTLGDLEASAVAYSKVISLAPYHTDSRLRLATLYVQLGQPDDALVLLESEPGTASSEDRLNYQSGTGVEPINTVPPSEIGASEKCTQDTRVVLHRYNLYRSKGDVAAYSRAGRTLLAFLFRDFHSRSEVKEMVQMKKIKTKLGLDPDKGKSSSETKREEKELESLLTPDEWYQTFVQTCEGLLSLGHSNRSTIVHLVYCACLSKRFSGGHLFKTFHFFSVSLSLLIQDYGTAFFLLKNIGNNYPECKHVWNIMNTLPLDSKVYKYILRLCFKHQSNPYLNRILSSHNQANGNYKFALSQYVTVFNKQTDVGDRYLISLCIALVFINMSCQSKKHSTWRNATVSQASAFLHTYIKLRGECQETSYNLGRVFHQLGVLHMVCHFYKQVLSMEPECTNPKWREVSDLRGEAGFNLALIYRGSGNNKLALHMLRTSCRL